MKAGPVLVRASAASASDPTEVPCEPQALVVQAAKLLELPPSQARPLAKERRDARIPRGRLHDEVVVVQGAKVGRKIFHALISLFPPCT